MKAILFIFVSLIVFCSAFSQTREELERQRIDKVRELEYTNKLLLQTEKSRSATIQKAGILKQRIHLRESLISGLGKEIALIDENISENERIIEQLGVDLEKAREEYGSLIYFSYKYRDQRLKLLFVLAAEDFNQGYRRIRYFQQIGKFRKRQIGAILEISQRMTDQLEALQNRKNQKVELLREHRNAASELVGEKQRYDKEINQLRKREGELKREINNQKKAAQSLESAIKAMIAEEAKLASGRKEIGLTPEEKIVSDNFRLNKGRLPWPTERGVITGFFGENPHPVLKGIKVQNNGIDILTTENAEVRAVFKGEVRKVLNIPGMNRGIIIRHGNFLTVYTNLAEVYVKLGDQVETKQKIGRVFSDRNDGNKSILHLEVWEESMKLDPVLWIGR